MDYTDLYNFKTSSGIIVPNDNTVLTGIQQKFQEIFGTDIDLSAETPVGRLIEAFAVMVKTTLGVTAQTANQFNVNEATGIYLDAIAQIYDMKRVAGTKTRISIKCYFSDNDSGTDTIPEGALILCSSTGNLFRIDSPIENPGVLATDDANGRPYATGTATAVDTGPIDPPIGGVNSIQTAVIGWVGVTNENTLYVGTDIETDEEFRKRIMESRPIGIGFITHLVAALNRLDGVYSNCILENNTGDSLVKKGVTIPAHSVYVGLDFIDTDELKSQIAEDIARAKPVGTGMVNSGVTQAQRFEQEVKYGYDDGYSQTIYFYKVKKTPIRVSLTYSIGMYTGDKIDEDIGNVVSAYIDTIGAGGVIYGTMIANRLINELDIGIASILIQKDNSEIPADNIIEMMGYETPYSSSTYITATPIA